MNRLQMNTALEGKEIVFQVIEGHTEAYAKIVQRYNGYLCDNRIYFRNKRTYL